MLQYRDVFSVFPQITEQRPAYEKNKGQTITDKNTKSKDFPYFPYFSTVFCLKHPLERKSWSFSAFLLIRFPSWKKRISKLSTFDSCSNQFLQLKGSIVQHSHTVYVFSLSAFYYSSVICLISLINAAPLTFWALSSEDSSKLGPFVLQCSFERI